MHDPARAGSPVRRVPLIPPEPPIRLSPPGGCPVNVLAYQALASARSLSGLLRKLRASMSSCRECPSRAVYPLQVEFYAKLTTALQEIADEWQLT